MAQTALDLSPQQWRMYRPDQRLEASDTEHISRLLQRRQAAYRVARQPAQILR